MGKHTFNSISRIFAIFALIFMSLLGSLGTASAQDDSCRLDKVSTANEIEGAGLQRMEVGGGAVQHVDYYVPGLDAVSYIVPPQEVPMIWWGFGSIWEGNGAECESFDWVADTERYAEDRLDSGHSGVVVDMRDGQVHNFGSLSDAEVDALLEAQKTAINTNVNAAPDQVNQDPANCDEDSGVGGLTGCAPDSGNSDEGATPAASGQSADCKATSESNDPVVGETWTVGGEGATIVNFWSNEPGVDQAERKLFLAEGETANLFGGGTSYSYPVGCADQAQTEFEENGLPAVTLEELESEGLVG